MKKIIVVVVLMLVLSVGLLSGCIGEEEENVLKYKTGKLVGVVEGNYGKVCLIFDDDFVLKGRAEYDAPYFKDFINETVEVRYFYEGYSNDIIDIKEI